MRVINHIIILALSLVCISCKVDFDFSGLDGQPLLYLDMNIAYDPTSYEDGIIPEDVHLSLNGFVYAIPSAAGEREFPEEIRCQLDVYHNSDLVWTRNDILLNEFEGLVAAEVYGIIPGDELKVVAKAEGFPTASSTVVVPQAAPKIEVSHSRINESKIRISIAFNDQAETDDCYAFTFTKAYWYEDSLNPSGVEWLEPSFGNTEETSFLDLGPFDVIWQDGDKYYGLTDREFNGKRTEFEINVEYPLHDPEQYKYAFYKIGIHKVSQERLNYEIACQDKGSNILGFIGLAPTTFAYTNVSGGTGCVSSSNVSTTEWIAVPPIEKIN